MVLLKEQNMKRLHPVAAAAISGVVVLLSSMLSCSREGGNPLSPSETIVTDIDGHVYTTVKIGVQWWMAENLKVTRFRNGEAIAHIRANPDWVGLDRAAYCMYGDDPANGDRYGVLYNWFAVQDPRGLAPEGWHIPSDEEWKTLEMTLGLDRGSADDVGGRGAREGGMLKEGGTVHWQPPNAGATNESGFTALPAGCRYHTNGSYSYRGYLTSYWASTSYDRNFAWARDLNYGYSQVYRTIYEKGAGFSVRCVKDGAQR